MRIFRSARLAVPVFAAMIGLKAGIARAGTNVWTTSGPEGGNISAWRLIPRRRLRCTPRSTGAESSRAQTGEKSGPARRSSGALFLSALAIDPSHPLRCTSGPTTEFTRASTGGGTGPGPALVCLARTFTPWRSIPSRPRRCTPRLPISAFSRASTAGETGPWPPQV